MMKIIHELEALGLVRRSTDPADSRAKLIEFTDAGGELIAELSESTKTVWRQYVRLIGAHELTSIFTSLRRLLELSGSEKPDE
jgi:DNA-binding MarR family transcriptional regulator